MTIIHYISVRRFMENVILADKYRYVNWIVFILAALANSVPTQAFSGVSPTITKVYEISQFQATIPSLLYPLSYIFILIPVNYILDKKGLKLGTIICQGCMILGLLVRLLINQNYYFFCLGTFICSLGFCFMLSGATKFANLWFPKHQVFMANSLCLFALFGSDALGTFLSAYFIREDATRESILQFFIWESGSIIIIQLLMVIFFKGSPKTNQNYASIAKRNTFKNDLKLLFKNKNYVLIFMAMTCIFGNVSIIFVFIPWITKTYSYETFSNGIILICANISGLVGCLLVGVFGERFSYKGKCLFLSIAMSGSLGLLWLSLQVGSQPFSYVIGGLSGLIVYPLLTTLSDFATQTTFPVGQATSGGILLFGGQFMGVVLVAIFSMIFDGSSLFLTRILNGILIIIVIFGIIILGFAKQVLKRKQYEDSKEIEGRDSLLLVDEQ